MVRSEGSCLQKKFPRLPPPRGERKSPGCGPHPGYPRIGKLAMYLFIAGYLLFCHGCHPHDFDDELWAKVQNLVAGVVAPEGSNK